MLGFTELLAELVAVMRARCAKKGILKEKIHETIMIAGNQLYLEIIAIVMKFCVVIFVGKDSSGYIVKQ